MIARAAECDFCPNVLEIDTAAGLTRADIDDIKSAPDALEPGWRSIRIDDREVIVFCPRCAAAYPLAADAIAASVQQVLDQRKALAS